MIYVLMYCSACVQKEVMPAFELKSMITPIVKPGEEGPNVAVVLCEHVDAALVPLGNNLRNLKGVQ